MMELLALYYKIYTDRVQPTDYVKWAYHALYLDDLNVKKLASMSMKEQLNIFEIEQMFEDAMNSLQREIPSKEQCIDFHLQQLHVRLLTPTEHAMTIVKEIYDCAIQHELLEEQIKWQGISDVMDDFQYGDNDHGYTLDKIHQMIVTHARKLWHTKASKIDFKEFIGQKIIAIDTEIHFIIQFKKGSLVIECPWRIRDTDGILLGETDILSNQQEWRTVNELLVGRTIEDVQLLEQCPILIVQCGNIFLDVFHASSYFDGWTLTDEEDFYVFSMHGGSIA
ncbi:hypothetical protein [Ornithinibacillus scapharcae]|uniref:hypothetical protein n=1 Tax=Ornithinibacillus scapharcae TaxID=1147159 RepID=UPI000225B0A9|nr:hypothetical protein [Ornithinibacillus scapharcae]